MNKGFRRGVGMEEALSSIVERMERIRKEREQAHAEHMRLLDEMAAAIRKLNEVKSRA